MAPLKTLVIKVDPDKPDKDVMDYIARAVREGSIVAFPTETVYGLAVNAADEKAVERLYGLKKRSRGKPFTVHIADIKIISKMGCRISEKAAGLMRKFWPGPLTIILKSKDGRKVGFRMPANKVALELIRRAGVPVIAPSANISGKKPPKSAREALKDLEGKIDIALDAGRTDIGIESTVIDLTVNPPVILRQGAISGKKLEKVLGRI